MTCTIFFRSFWGAERANPPQSRHNARLCSITGLLTWPMEISPGFSSLRENKPLKNSKVFLYVYSPSLPPLPCCCFSPQSSCKRLPFKVKLGLERSSPGAVSPPPSSLLPPEVTQDETASFSLLPGWLVRSHTRQTAHCRSRAVLVRRDGHLRVSWGVWKDTHSFFIPGLSSWTHSFWHAGLMGNRAQNKNELITILLPPLPNPQAFLQNNQFCIRIVLKTGSGWTPDGPHLCEHRWDINLPTVLSLRNNPGSPNSRR